MNEGINTVIIIIVLYKSLELLARIIRHLFVSRGASKGAGGRVAVFGGSQLYAGAPVFAAKAALSLGADYVFIATSAHLPTLTTIKTNCLDAIVVSPQNYSVVRHVTAVVVGPGLQGDDDSSERYVGGIKAADKAVLVLDGNSQLLTQHIDTICASKATKIVWTPNEREYKAVTPEIRQKLLQNNVAILRKGAIDRFYYQTRSISFFGLSLIGSRKRVAGQGDLLAGALAQLLSTHSTVNAVRLALFSVRFAAFRAELRAGVSLTSDRILRILMHE